MEQCLYKRFKCFDNLNEFLVHLSRRLKCTIVITRCPSSVRPSVCLFVRLSSVVNFSHFRLLVWNCLTEFNESWQEARTQHPLLSLCFSGRSEKQDGRPGLWLNETFSTSPLKQLNRIQWNLTGNKILMSSTKFVFSGRSETQDGSPYLWLADTFSTSPPKPLIEIQRNLTGRKILMSSTKFVFFGPIGKQDGRPALWLVETFSTSPPKLLNGIQRNMTGSKVSRSSTKFVFFFFFWGGGLIETFFLPKQDGRPGLWLAETFSTSTLKWIHGIQRNLTRFRSKISTSSTKFTFFLPIGKKMAALVSDWLIHFRLLL